jgi:DNA/RNA endonuclease YhcR with UshA esterase domain
MKMRLISLTTFASIVAGMSWLLAAVPASAHHSFNAEYDASKPLKLTGTVTKVEWKNPHAYFYVDVTDETGKVTNWALEMGGSSALLRAGWGPNTTKVGDVLTVEGSPAKDGSNVANAKVVVLQRTGQRLFAGSSQEIIGQENRP